VVSDSIAGNPFLFAGYFHDNETGLYHVRHRMYSPTLQRWLQRDPAGLRVGDLNAYEYARSQPAQVTDPSGLRPPPPVDLNTDCLQFTDRCDFWYCVHEKQCLELYKRTDAPHDPLNATYYECSRVALCHFRRCEYDKNPPPKLWTCVRTDYVVNAWFGGDLEKCKTELLKWVTRWERSVDVLLIAVSPPKKNCVPDSNPYVIALRAVRWVEASVLKPVWTYEICFWPVCVEWDWVVVPPPQCDDFPWQK